MQLADLWRESGRYDAYGPEMLRIKDRHERELLYGPTNEDMITEIFRAYVRSYRDLPKILYHIQWKFRDEQRPRFGVMRGREFLMKDAYSFDLDEAAARLSYNKMFVAYLRTFARMGLKAIPMRAETGPIGGDLSHEFIILAETGESGVYCNKDVLDLPVPGADVDYDADLDADHRAVDQPLRGDRGRARRGPLRARGAARQARARARHRGRADLLLRHQVLRADEGGGVRPGRRRAADPRRVLRRRRLAPGRRDHRGVPRRCRHQVAGGGRALQVAILNLKQGGSDTDAACEQLYRALTAKGVDVLYDDTDERPGAKFATADLIGIPWQVLVGPRGSPRARSSSSAAPTAARN